MGASFLLPSPPMKKKRLLEGLDDIAITLQKENDIRRYEEWRRRVEPWVFDNGKNSA